MLTTSLSVASHFLIETHYILSRVAGLLPVHLGRKFPRRPATDELHSQKGASRCLGRFGRYRLSFP